MDKLRVQLVMKYWLLENDRKEVRQGEEMGEGLYPD